jgi:hypothetical protein
MKKADTRKEVKTPKEPPFDRTIKGWCVRHNCCRQTAVNEIKSARLRIYRVGTRGVRISPEADAAWEKSRESESRAA